MATAWNTDWPRGEGGKMKGDRARPEGRGRREKGLGFRAPATLVTGL